MLAAEDSYLCGECDGRGYIVICKFGREHRCEDIFADQIIDGECCATCDRCSGSGDEPRKWRDEQMPMDHSDERRRLVNMRGLLDTSIRALGDAADAAQLLGLSPESRDLRGCQVKIRIILSNVEQRLER